MTDINDIETIDFVDLPMKTMGVIMAAPEDISFTFFVKVKPKGGYEVTAIESNQVGLFLAQMTDPDQWLRVRLQGEW